jgi:preprotein translocase subunit SecD
MLPMRNSKIKELCSFLVLLLMLACNSIWPLNAITRATSSEVLVIAPTDPSPIIDDLEDTHEALQSRLDEELASPVTVKTTEGQFLVEIEDPDDVELALQLILHPQRTIFFASDMPYTEGDIVPVDTMPVMEGYNMIAAFATPSPPGQWQVQMKLTSVGGRMLDTYVDGNVGRFLNVAQDNVVILSIRIGGMGEDESVVQVYDTLVNIHLPLSETKARELASKLNNSQFLLELELVEKR